MSLSKINKYSIIVITISIIYIIFTTFKSKNKDVIDTPLGAISIGPIVDLTPEEEEKKLIEEFERKEKALNKKRENEKFVSNLKTKRSESNYNISVKNENKRLIDEQKERNTKISSAEAQRKKEAAGFESETKKVKQLEALKEKLKREKASEKKKSDGLKVQDKAKLDASLKKEIAAQKAYVVKQKAAIARTYSNSVSSPNRTLRNVSKSLKNPLGSSMSPLGSSSEATIEKNGFLGFSLSTIQNQIKKAVETARQNQSSLDKVDDTNPPKLTPAQKTASRAIVAAERKRTDDLAKLNIENRQTVTDSKDKYMEDLKAIDTRRDNELKAVFAKLVSKYNQDVTRINNS